MNLLDDNSIPIEDRRNYAFQISCAIRESISIARKLPQPITYENSFDIINDVNPNLYNSITTLLANKNESDTVKLYKEMAELLSTDIKKVSPIDLIDSEIEKNELLSQTPKEASKRFINKKIIELKAAKEFFKPREVSEHKILNHDFFLANRDGYFAKKLYENDSYKDYSLGTNKVLRLRLLHPDKFEVILGADLIYEHFDLLNERVRFTHLQYKAWNTNVMYFSESKSVSDQLDKMEKHLCKNNFCTSNTQDKNFRLPYCAGFLRPTSKIQSSESKLVTSGMHIPVCIAQDLKDVEKKITKSNISEKSISSNIFEELFNYNLIGSRWIKISELEKFYEQNKIASLTDSIRIHAQEVDLATEEEIDNKKFGL